MTDDQPSIDEPDWNDTDAPEQGQIVQVRSKNHRGFYIVPFPVEFRDDEWWNVRTRSVSTILRHPVLEFKLGFLVF